MTHPLERVTCRQAAATVREVAGLAAYGQTVGKMLHTLEACNGAFCPGHVAIEVVEAAAKKANEDAILALLN